jgi:phospholipid-binding lipoprotein MlaA
LQLKLRQAAELGGRVVINSLWGLGGLVDVASDLGLEHRSEDFGQTLGRWGVPSGPYLVLPLLGPSSVRDAAATLTLDRYMDPLTHIDHLPVRLSMFGLRAVDTRTNLLKVTNVLDDIALDRYTFTRDAYLQRRFAEVSRGRPALPPLDPGDTWDGRDDSPAPAVPAAPPSPAGPKVNPALPSSGLTAPEHNPKL